MAGGFVVVVGEGLIFEFHLHTPPIHHPASTTTFITTATTLTTTTAFPTLPTFPTFPPAPPITLCIPSALRLHCRGAAVQQLQFALIQCGFLSAAAIRNRSGVFGPYTQGHKVKVVKSEE